MIIKIELTGSSGAAHPKYYFEQSEELRLAGVRVDEKDPLAVLKHGKKDGQLAGDEEALSYFDDIGDGETEKEADGTVAVRAKIQGTIWKNQHCRW